MRELFSKLMPPALLDGQLRLLLSNMGGSVLPAVLFISALAWRVHDSVQTQTVVLWWFATLATSILSWQHARYHLKRGWSPDKEKNIVWQSCLINGLDGCFWGLLTWISFGLNDTQLELIVLATLTGVAAQNQGQLSAVPQVFLSFLTCLILCGDLRMIMDSDAALRLLGWGGLLLFTTFTVQALNSAQVVRRSLTLATEKDALLKANDEARQAAVKANADKSLFLASASHDLRQPVHAQALFLEVLSETPLENFQKDLLANARLAASASSELLDALLDFSRLEAGVVTPVLRPFFIQDIFQKIENELAPMAEAKGLVYRCRETLSACFSDPALIELILRNLTSNAIRYTLEGGVLVGARQRTGLLVVEVWDTGLGIEPEQQEAIFQEFHQLNNPARDRRKGLGLGLAIAKGLADRLGHKLTLHSRPGQGSVFRLEIPVYTGVIAAVNLPDSSKISLIGKKALVLDDDPLALQSMGSLLQNWGMSCELANSVNQALAMSKNCRPDIIITDYRLSEERTGAQAIALVRLELGEQMPALIVTGDTSPQRLREASASGVPLLHKPANPDDVRRLISQALAQNFTD